MDLANLVFSPAKKFLEMTKDNNKNNSELKTSNNYIYKFQTASKETLFTTFQYITDFAKKLAETNKNTYLNKIQNASKAAIFLGSRYEIYIRKNGVVNVIDKMFGKNGWIFRIDHPHLNTKYNFFHLNINPRITNIAKDPHIPMSPEVFQVATTTAQVIKTGTYIMVSLAITRDFCKIISSAYKDYTSGTTSNTVETVSSIAGEYGGAYAGFVGGVKVGTVIFPGIGTLIGGIVGSTAGVTAGPVLLEKVTSGIGDQHEWYRLTVWCKSCINNPYVTEQLTNYFISDKNRQYLLQHLHKFMSTTGLPSFSFYKN